MNAENPTAPRQTVGVTGSLPRNKRIERQGLTAAPHVRHYPMVRGGICDYCGVLDQNVDSINQYKLCEHYRGMELRCSYCPAEKNPTDTIKQHILSITDHPTDPGALVVCCDSTVCVTEHHKKWAMGR